MNGCNGTDRAPTWQLEMGNTCDSHLATIESQGKWNLNTKRIPEDTRINEDLLYKELSCQSRLGLFKKIPIRKRLLQEVMSTFYYKSPNTLINQGTHNLPFSSTLEL